MKKVLFLCACLLPGAAALAHDESETIITHKHELKLGVLAHSRGFISKQREEGQDYTVAYYHRIAKLHRKDMFFHVGASANNAKGTNFVYTGLDWRWRPLGEKVYTLFGAGIGYHDGRTQKTDLEIDGLESFDKAAYGSQLMFHFQGEVGYQFTERYSVGFYLDHMSHGYLGDRNINPGLDTVGFRLGVGL
jgi:hypothetical protein